MPVDHSETRVVDTGGRRQLRRAQTCRVGAGLREPRDRWDGPQARGVRVRFEKTLLGPRSTLHGPEAYMSERAR